MVATMGRRSQGAALRTGGVRDRPGLRPGSAPAPPRRTAPTTRSPHTARPGWRYAACLTSAAGRTCSSRRSRPRPGSPGARRGRSPPGGRTRPARSRSPTASDGTARAAAALPALRAPTPPPAPIPPAARAASARRPAWWRVPLRGCHPTRLEAQVGHRPCLQREVAGSLVAGLALRQQGLLDVADALLEARAARVEPAGGRGVDRAGHIALEHDRLAAAGHV